MDHFDQVGLRRDDSVDVLIGVGRLVNHAFVLAAFDVARRPPVTLQREGPPNRGARYGAAGAMVAGPALLTFESAILRPNPRVAAAIGA